MEQAVETAKRESRSTEGYSLPISLHQRIRAEAAKRDWNRSDLVRKAVRYYLKALDVHASSTDEDE